MNKTPQMIAQIPQSGETACAVSAETAARSFCPQRESVAVLPPGPWLNPDQALVYLGLPSRKALYQAVRRGQIPAHRLGRRLRFNRRELDALLSANSTTCLSGPVGYDAIDGARLPERRRKL